MKPKRRNYLIVIIGLALPAIVVSQGRIQSLVVSGGQGSAPITQINGRNYVDVEALARAANGSLSFNGNQVVLTLGGGSNGGSQSAPPASNQGSSTGFSSAFLRAGIEAMSTLREWHSALASLIQNGYPVTSQELSRFQGQATSSLRLAQTSATTDTDQQGMQLIDNAYQKMKQLSDKYIAMRANMTYIAPNSLDNDPLNQSLVACGKALSGMAATQQLTSDSACQ